MQNYLLNKAATQTTITNHISDTFQKNIMKELQQRSIQRKQEIKKQFERSEKQLKQRFDSVDAQVLQQFQKRQKILESLRNVKAEQEINDERVRYKEDIKTRLQLLESDNKFVQQIHQFKNLSKIAQLKEDLVLKELQNKKQTILSQIQNSKTKEINIKNAIAKLQQSL